MKKSERAFLRKLISRQKTFTNVLTFRDRKHEIQTVVLTEAEARRIEQMAKRKKISIWEMLQRAKIANQSNTVALIE